MILLNILVIFIFIGLNAFFVAVEYAAVASRRSRLEVLTEKETRGSKIVHDWLEDPKARDRLIAANQVAITLINLAVGAVSEDTFSALLLPGFNAILLPTGFEFLRSV